MRRPPTVKAGAIHGKFPWTFTGVPRTTALTDTPDQGGLRSRWVGVGAIARTMVVVRNVHCRVRFRSSASLARGFARQDPTRGDGQESMRTNGRNCTAYKSAPRGQAHGPSTCSARSSSRTHRRLRCMARQLGTSNKPKHGLLREHGVATAKRPGKSKPHTHTHTQCHEQQTESRPILSGQRVAKYTLGNPHT